MGVDYFLEAIHPRTHELAFFKSRIRTLPPSSPSLDHRLSGQFTALIIVRADMTFDFGSLGGAFRIHRKNRYARCVACLTAGPMDILSTGTKTMATTFLQ